MGSQALILCDTSADVRVNEVLRLGQPTIGTDAAGPGTVTKPDPFLRRGEAEQWVHGICGLAKEVLLG
jgi:hypothetical protein